MKKFFSCRFTSIIKKIERYGITIELTKYCLTGGVTTIFSLAIFTACLYLFSIHPILALIIGTTSGMLVSYLLNFIWVFKPEENIVFKERLPKYLATNMTTLLINIICLQTLIRTTHYQVIYLQLAIAAPIIVINYLAAKFWSLKKGH